MTLKELKQSIENGTVGSDFLLLQTKDQSSVFVVQQYANEIAKQHNRDTVYIHSVEEIPVAGIFSDGKIPDGELYIYITDKLPIINDFDSVKLDNLIIAASTINQPEATAIAIEVPKLTDEFIIEYGVAVTGLKVEEIKQLYDRCKNIYRFQSELDKLTIFDKAQRKMLFDLYCEDETFTDMNASDIFEFSNAVQNKDYNKLLSVYHQFEKSDIEPLALVTILYRNFKNMIKVLCQKNATPENTQLSEKQIWAIRRYCTHYNFQQLVKSFRLVANMEYMLKSGRIEEKYLVDYMTLKVMTY